MKSTKRYDVLLATAPMVPSRSEGIRRFASEAGWNLIDLSRLVGGTAGLGGWRGDGALVTLRRDSEIVSFVRRLRRAHIPVVDLTDQRLDIKVPRTCLDNRMVGHMAAKHFVERNFRHAAWFSTNWMNSQSERFNGFVETWNELRSRVSKPSMDPVLPERWVLSESLPAKRQNDQRAVAQWFGKLLRAAPKPLALVCHCGEDAARVLAECRELGITVPDEIAILSAGDYFGLCKMQTIPISSVGIAGERHGYEAAALLQHLMDGETPPCNPILIPPDPVIVRASTDHTASTDPLVASALALIDKNLHHAWGVAQLCLSLNVTELKLERHFMKELNLSPSDLILKRRIERAKKLLRETNMTTSDVAANCGLCHASYLSNIFHRETGFTPKEWRTSKKM